MSDSITLTREQVERLDKLADWIERDRHEADKGLRVRAGHPFDAIRPLRASHSVGFPVTPAQIRPILLALLGAAVLLRAGDLPPVR